MWTSSSTPKDENNVVAETMKNTILVRNLISTEIRTTIEIMITKIKTATEIETTPEDRIILEKESAPQMMTRMLDMALII